MDNCQNCASGDAKIQELEASLADARLHLKCGWEKAARELQEKLKESESKYMILKLSHDLFREKLRVAEGEAASLNEIVGGMRIALETEQVIRKERNNQLTANKEKLREVARLLNPLAELKIKNVTDALKLLGEMGIDL